MQEIVDAQIEQQGVAAIAVSDGHVLVFETATLERLLARAIESAEGRVIVFVKHGVQS